jgi:hypothetical protein
VPIGHRALARGADDKARAPIQQGFQQILPIAAAVHGPDPTPPGGAPIKSTAAGTSAFSLVKSLASTENGFSYKGRIWLPFTSAAVTPHSQ